PVARGKRSSGKRPMTKHGASAQRDLFAEPSQAMRLGAIERAKAVEQLQVLLMEAMAALSGRQERAMTKITPEHLARGAVVYVRQSTAVQVVHNLESQRRQYGLADRARQVGWADVEVID